MLNVYHYIKAYHTNYLFTTLFTSIIEERDEETGRLLHSGQRQGEGLLGVLA